MEEVWRCDWCREEKPCEWKLELAKYPEELWTFCSYSCLEQWVAQGERRRAWH